MGPGTPNYQGLFLRGYGSQAHAQNNGSVFGISSTSHSSGGLNVIQGDAIRNIYGDIWGFFGARDKGAVYAVKEYHGEHPVIYGNVSDYDYTWFRGTDAIDASRIVPTGNENRPVNIAVRYLIRARE